MRGQAMALQVAVTRARNQGASIAVPGAGASVSPGATTSATATARVCAPTRMRAQEDNPNQPCAGLSRVHGQGGVDRAAPAVMVTVIVIVQQPDPAADDGGLPTFIDR